MKILTQDLGIKTVSLLLAVGLWFYAVSEENVEVRRSIPLEIQIQNPKLSVLKAATDHVWVVLTGPRNMLADLTSKEISAVHKIGPEVNSAGDYSFRLEEREIQLPVPQVQVSKIYPETVQVTVDELITQRLPVTPNFVGEPAFGYKVRSEGIELNPNAVLLEGPKGQLSEIDAVMTEAVDLVGRIRSFRRTVDLELPPNIKALSESLVDLFVPIQEELAEQEFSDIPVKILQPPDKSWTVVIEPEVVSFVLKGSAASLKNLDAKDLVSYVDLSDLRRGVYEMEVRLVLPPDVALKDPVTVQVTIDKAV